MDRPKLEIRGSTLLIDIIRAYPAGEAQALMSRLAWPCGHCGGMTSEPLSMAAKRHGHNAGKVIECFRALETGGPTDEQVDAARAGDGRQKPDLFARYPGFSVSKRR